jgi:uncharacterized oligopeptide transporter (OPT) family protein
LAVGRTQEVIVNFAFVVVVVAAVSGLLSELALRAIAPQAGPALSLAIMALALIGAASRMGQPKKRQEQQPVPVPMKTGGARESLSPV